MVEPLAVVRARHLKSVLECVAARPDAGLVLPHIPPDVLRQVTEAGGLDWLPVAHNVAITRAVYDGLGTASADRFFRDQALSSYEGPLLQTLVSTALKVFGRDPASVIRWVPRGWHLVYRNVGTWTVSELGPGKDSLWLKVGGLPEVCAADRVWLRAVSRSLSALLVLARAPGTVEVQPRAPGSREAVYEFRWDVRASDGSPSPRA